MNVNIKTLLLLLGIHLNFGACYSVEGDWTLRNLQIPLLASIKKPIRFQFDKQPSGLDQQITGYLTISACNILTYNYEVQDSQIFFTYVSLGRSTRNCEPQELIFLRTQLDETFYFYIQYNVMILKPPNTIPPIKLDRIVTTSPPSINGVWIITDAISFDKINDSLVIVNGSEIQLCRGRSSFTYKITNYPNISFIRKDKTACNAELTSKMESISVYKYNPTSLRTTISFYSRNGTVVMELTSQEAYSSGIAVDFDKKTVNAAIKKDQLRGVAFWNKVSVLEPTNISTSFIAKNNNRINNSSNNSAALTNITSNSNQITKTASTPLTTTNAAQTNSTITVNSSSNTVKNQTTSSINSKNTTDIKISTNTSTPTNNTTNKSNTTNTTIKNSSTSTTALTTPIIASTTTNLTKINNNISSTTPKNVSQTIPNISNTALTPIDKPVFAIVKTVSDIYDVWYPINTDQIQGLSALPQPNTYQILINAQRVVLAGGCNTIFSKYTFSSGKFQNLSVNSANNSCPNNQDSLLQNIIFNSNNSYYSASTNNPKQKLINIQSDRGVLLLQLTTTTPKTSVASNAKPTGK